ncbi:MAG: HlyD family efflux transporter periplasmic adaptor subunit [Saprospiraceae bacterium]
MENSIIATGQIIPAFENQLNAPIATDIAAVHLRAGHQVEQGDLILTLNRQYIEWEVAARSSQLDLKKNAGTLLDMELERDLRELALDNDIKGLQVEAAQAQLTDAQRLLNIGGTTVEAVEEARTHLSILQLEKAKLENELNYRRRSLDGRRRQLALEADVEAQQLAELQNKLQLTEVRASAPGVITWVNEHIGEQVAEGNPLVRIADLRSFQVEASCSDRYADRIQPGQPVRVRINNRLLDGEISHIRPAVANNTVEFIVNLAKADDESLRPNMRVEVLVVTDTRADVLKIKRGPAFKGGQRQYVFWVDGAIARRIEVRLGAGNGDELEIISDALQPGDRLIISDMTDYEHLEQIQLQ